MSVAERLDIFYECCRFRGSLVALDGATGRQIWKTYTNEIPARGGSLNGLGPAIAGGMVFVESGYAANGIPGNVLLAFSVDGK